MFENSKDVRVIGYPNDPVAIPRVVVPDISWQERKIAGFSNCSKCKRLLHDSVIGIGDMCYSCQTEE